MALDVDLLAIGKSRLELLGQDSSGSKPANQLQPSLAQLVESALIESDLRGDIPEPAVDDRAAVDTRQQIFLIREPRSAVRLAVLNWPAMWGLSPNYNGCILGISSARAYQVLPSWEISKIKLTG